MPIDRGAIDGQLREIGEGERWWEQREFRDLPYVLDAGERIRGIINGKILGRRRPGFLPASQWLIVVTDSRLICLRRQRFGRQQVDIYLAQITGMRHSSRLRSVRIVLDTPQRRYRLRVPKEDAFRFVGALAPLIPQPAALADGSPTMRLLPGVASVPGLSKLVTELMAPPPNLVTRAELARVQAVVERLEGEVERLQQHVEFLEDLLQKRADGTLPEPWRPADS